MTEIRLRFDLAFSRRFLTLAGAGAIMLCAVPELDSESVTLSTYYPAPSGVYTNMITTGHTYMARDGGLHPAAGSSMLVLGGSAINAYANGLKLHLPQGQIGIGQQNDATPYMRVGMDTGWVQFVANNAYWTGGAYNYVNPAGYGGTASRMSQVSGTIGFDTASGGVNPVTWNNRMTIANNGNITVPGSTRVNGPYVSGQGAACSVPQTVTYPTPGGGTRALCPGQFITTTGGFYTKYIVLPVDRGPNLSPPVNPSANYLCCPCPAGGCTL